MWWGIRELQYSRGQRKLEESDGGLLPAVEGDSLEWSRIKQCQS